MKKFKIIIRERLFDGQIKLIENNVEAENIDTATEKVIKKISQSDELEYDDYFEEFKCWKTGSIYSLVAGKEL